MEHMNDTDPKIAKMVSDRLRTLSGADRFLMGVKMFTSARRMALASLPSGLTEAERKRLLFERIYGEPFPTKSPNESPRG